VSAQGRHVIPASTSSLADDDDDDGQPVYLLSFVVFPS